MHINIFAVIKILLLSTFLSACGGGGGDKTTSASSQSSSFLSVNISSSSSVNSKTIQMTAWIGTEDTLVNFSEDVAGFEFYHSTDLYCDLATYASCSNGQLHILNGSSTITLATTSTHPGYTTLSQANQEAMITLSTKKLGENGSYRSKRAKFKNKLWLIEGYDGSINNNEILASTDGINWSTQAQDHPFKTRINHSMIEFKGLFWLVGGSDKFENDSRLMNDIWSSTDGINWSLQNASAGFSPRTGHQLAVFNGKIWLFGGIDSKELKTDIWSSTDGIVWTEEFSNSDFYKHGAQVVNYKNRLWLFGGDSGSYPDGESAVWSTMNGVTWQLSVSDVPEIRHPHVTVHSNKLWLIGDRTYPNSVWSSDDGIKWTKLTSSAEFAGRTEQLISFNNKLLLMENKDLNGYSNLVWSSLDGITWFDEITSFTFPVVHDHKSVSFNDQLWLIGSIPSSNYKTEVWSSIDGIIWKQRNITSLFTSRYSIRHHLIAFNNKLWVFGGITSGATDEWHMKDIWSSQDGLEWVKESISGFPSRFLSGIASFNNKLWIVGGYDFVTGNKNDVWSSVDGVNWIQESQSSMFSARHGHALVVFNNKLWIIGGEDSSGARNDIWSSVDGINWILETLDAGFSPRYDHKVSVLQNKLWLVGSQYTNDIWSSDDGVLWELHTEKAQFSGSGRERFDLTLFDNRLVVTGGYGSERVNDVWSSADGINWRKGFRGTFEFQQ